MLAATGHPHSLDWDELSLTWAGDPKLCRNIEVRSVPSFWFLFQRYNFRDPSKPSTASSTWPSTGLRLTSSPLDSVWVPTSLTSKLYIIIHFQLSFLPGGKIPDFDIGDANIDSCSTMSVNNVKLALCLPASCEKDPVSILTLFFFILPEISRRETHTLIVCPILRGKL